MGLNAEAGKGKRALVARDRNRLPPDGTVARVSGTVFAVLRCEQVRRATDPYRAGFFAAVRCRSRQVSEPGQDLPDACGVGAVRGVKAQPGTPARTARRMAAALWLPGMSGLPMSPWPRVEQDLARQSCTRLRC